jgi:sigma-B regulation protein RsbU (phosphoserine phosphatase)
VDEPEQLSVGDIISREPVAVAPSATVAEVAILMGDRNIGAVAVCRDGDLVGIFTERDLLRRAATERHRWESTPIAVFMSPEPTTVQADQTWTAAMELMERRGVRHLPVLDGSRLVGMLSVRDLLPHRQRYLEWMVQQRTADLGAKNRELAERDQLMQFHLDMAGSIQRQMLPATLPISPRLDFAVTYQPLDKVSGDYYDFARPDPDLVGVMIADASGHGVPAAFVSVMVKTAFQAYGRTIESPAAALCTLNKRLSNLIAAGHFVTMCYAIVDTATLQCTYARAGHPQPLWFSARRGTVTPLDADGTLIGGLPEPRFEDRTVQLEPGDIVLFYTDGVVESQNESQEIFGRDRLGQFLLGNQGRTSSAVLQALDATLAAFRGDRPFGDDVTCIALRVL